MIELDRKDIEIHGYTEKFKSVALFDKLHLDFRKRGSGDHIRWEHRGTGRVGKTGTKTGLAIYHSGRLRTHAVKKTIEYYLNRSPHLRHVIIESFFI